MKKLLTGFLIAVFSLSVSANAKTSDFSESNVEKAPTASTIKGLEINRSATKSKSSAKVLQHTYTLAANGALATETFYDDYNGFTVYYNTASVVANPYVTKISAYNKYSNKVVGISETRVLNKNVYTYNSIDTYGANINKYTKYATYTHIEYNSAKKKTLSIVQKKNTKGVITRNESKTFYTNGKMSSYYLVLKNTANKITKQDARVYYSNGKLKNRVVYNRNSKGVITAGYRSLGRSNGTKKVYRKLYYKAGKPRKMVEYLYNKKGQAKSNKNGNAYRVTYTINKSKKVTKIMKAKYNKKGKLGKSYKARVKSRVVYF